MIWPRSENVTHINYHYTQFGEIVDYLNSVTENQVIALDCDIETNDITDIIEKNSVSKIIMNVNYENAMNAFKMAQEIKKRYKAISMMAYGNLTVMFPELFINSDFDAIYRDGDFETCIESFINNYENKNKRSKHMLKKAVVDCRCMSDDLFFSFCICCICSQ